MGVLVGAVEKWRRTTDLDGRCRSRWRWSDMMTVCVGDGFREIQLFRVEEGFYFYFSFSFLANILF